MSINLKREDFKMKRYAVSIEKVYNCFDAWVETEVILYKLSKSGKKWKPIDSWSYDAIFSRRFSEIRASSKARSLMLEYRACLI